MAWFWPVAYRVAARVSLPPGVAISQARIVCQLSVIVTGLRLGRVLRKGLIADGPFRGLIPLLAAASQPD